MRGGYNEDLIVFPGILSTENQLTIKIDYISGEDQLTTFVKISNGEWQPGKSYTYMFQADYASYHHNKNPKVKLKTN